jgi:uncharacterized protein YndB with AHSA1/START domain
MSGFALAAQGARDILISRNFPGPAARLFEALTSPELIRQWMLGPPGWTMAICKTDPVPGGEFRYLWHNEGGEELGMRGRYLEVDPPRHLVHAERFDGAGEDDEATISSELTEIEGRTTTLRATVRYATPEARDAMLATDMASGVSASYDRLAAILAGS